MQYDMKSVPKQRCQDVAIIPANLSCLTPFFYSQIMLGMTHDEFPVSAILHAVMFSKYKKICLLNGKYDMQTTPNKAKHFHDVRNLKKGTLTLWFV